MRNLRIISSILALSILSSVFAKEISQDRQSYKIYVDKEGVMRRTDTKEEVSYYGTNYTLPFAHAYRAVGELGLDRKEAIDRDVYHLKRLGFNGFRLHLWDVEISDSVGNLLQNDHLDLLDYLISRLEKEGIDIILTAQTNFGNGYPEKNIDTGAFTYDYDKCEIHSNKTAQEIQANYLSQLASHKNPYTGKSYSDDNAIIAIEINNEPCHTDSKKEVTAYINKMVKALKKGGFDKPILYNVSHNPEVTGAYYDADIQGTTYQWYPTGLVTGHQRKGNFLPYVDQYPIPWSDSIKNFNKMARVVYEFDPGDVLYSYLYPAIARTFRKEGFQWITQFAYDPIDIAKYNTEYQTHFLNLAYTPSKAISMMIAGEAARNIPRGANFGRFPTDTVFGDFLVSYMEDLSLYNTPEKFYYTNSTSVAPKDISKLTNLAGVGSSPVIEYEGTGAYFLDEIKPGLWRLEVMPDVILISDPFTKPSLNKEIGKIFYSEQPLNISLPQLGTQYEFIGINDGNSRKGTAENGTFKAYPGVYLLSANPDLISSEISSPEFVDSGLEKYVAPQASESNSIVSYQAPAYINSDEDFNINIKIIGNDTPDEVIIYPEYVSFWNEENNLIPMQRKEGNIYTATISKDQLGWNPYFNFNIVIKEDGKSFTWPQNIEGTPLDWDFTNYEYYSSKKLKEADPIVLLTPQEKDQNIDTAMLPESWNFRFFPDIKAPVENDAYILSSNAENDGEIIIRRYVGDELSEAPFLENKKNIVVKISPSGAQEGIKIGLTGKNGATYAADLLPAYQKEPVVKLHGEVTEYHIPLTSLTQTETYILPSVYPSFLPRKIEMEPLPFIPEEIEFVELIYPTKKGNEIFSKLEGIWLE